MDRAEYWRTTRALDLKSDPRRYSFSWPGPRAEEELRSSVGRWGLFRSLIAVEEGDGLVVAAGHRRLSVLKAQGDEGVPVRVVPAEPRTRLWDLLLADHLDSRPFNPVEIGLYLQRRAAETDERPRELAGSVLPRLGLPPRATSVEDPLWIAGLPQRYKDAFAEGRLPPQGVRILARASREDALAVLDILDGMTVGVNKFSEIARLILECAWREGLPVPEWTQTGRLTGMAATPEGLLGELRTCRYPKLSKWDEAFSRDVRNAKLPENVKVSHPKGFEGRHLRCTATFSTLRELETSLRGLLEAVRAGRLDPLAEYLE